MMNTHSKLAKESLSKVLNNTPGFLLTLERQSLLEEIDKVFKSHGGKYSQVVVCGIGGSSLGVRVIKDALQKSNLFVLENVDHYDFKKMQEWVMDPKTTAFIFISKSGSTLETLVSLELIQQWGNQAGFKLSAQSFVITEFKESSLYQWAKKNQVPCLEVPKDVGGRFSVLTTVGMFPAVMMGCQPQKFIDGAQSLLKNDIVLVEEFIAKALLSFEQEKWITQFWLYGTSLKSFGEWLVQLWSESLGKKLEHNFSKRASTPIVALGAIDQHSMLQQTMEGAKDKWPVFIRSGDHENQGAQISAQLFPETKLVQQRRIGDVLRVEAIATREALEKQGVLTHELFIPNLSEHSLGYWFLFFELVVAGLGEALQVNAFDQPGVELGKRLAQEKLKNEGLSGT